MSPMCILVIIGDFLVAGCIFESTTSHFASDPALATSLLVSRVTPSCPYRSSSMHRGTYSGVMSSQQSSYWLRGLSTTAALVLDPSAASMCQVPPSDRGSCGTNRMRACTPPRGLMVTY